MNIARDQIVDYILKCASILVKSIMLNVEDTYVQKITNIARCFTEKKMSNIWTMVSKIRRAKRSTACQMDGHTDEVDTLQIFAVKCNLIYNSVGYDCIDMANILADNENDIIHMCSMISNHNSELHLLCLIKIRLLKLCLICKLVKVTVLMGYHPIIFNIALIYYMYIYHVCLIVY